MLVNANLSNLNLVQSINSFMRPVGLCLSNNKQIIDKITTIAFAAIVIIGNLSLASADSSVNCVMTCPELNDENANATIASIKACFDQCPNGY